MRSSLCLLIVASCGLSAALPEPFKESVFKFIEPSSDSRYLVKRQADDEAPRSTDKCPPATYEQEVAKADRCLGKANSIVDEFFLNGGDFLEIDSAICQSMAARDKCFNTMHKKCYEEAEARERNLRYLEREMERAFNMTLLGQSFIDSCPVLSRNQGDVVQLYTGSRRCNYFEFQTSYLAHVDCMDESWEQFARGKQIIPLISDEKTSIMRVECGLREAQLVTCPAIKEQCNSVEKQNELMRSGGIYMASREQNYKNDWDWFSYDICKSIAEGKTVDEVATKDVEVFSPVRLARN